MIDEGRGTRDVFLNRPNESQSFWDEWSSKSHVSSDGRPSMSLGKS